MLKLVYSPYYDGNCFAENPASGKCELGTKHVGNLGLLAELELRAGLSRGDVSPMQRAIAYCNAIQQVLNGEPTSQPFYQDSYENDPLGVAQQLLSWRDALTMAGWSAKTSLPSTLSVDGANRLADLQAIEQYFKSIGVGERWNALLNEAGKRKILPAGTTITVDMKMDYVHPVIRKVLELVGAHESEGVANLGKKTLKDFEKKFTLCEFPEQNDAYQWTALQNFENAVFVNEDNFTFNQVLKSVGKPLVGASAEGGAAELSQLLKLGISLFRNPVNVSNLIDYLSIFKHPLDYETRSALKYHISNVGGFGDRVKKNGSVIKFASIAPKSNFWGMWDKCSNEKVAIKAVRDFCEDLLNWTKKAMDKATAEMAMNPLTGTQVCSQLSILQEQVGNLKLILANRKGDISNDELDKIVTSLCQSESVTTDIARLGSCNMLKDLKGLATKAGTVIWMDCVLKPRRRYEYAFLNPKDIVTLQSGSLDIPAPELEMRASDFAEKLAVSRASEIIALMPKRKDGIRTEENLLITELRTLNKGITINATALPVSENVTCVNADSQEVEHRVDKSLFAHITVPSPSKSEEKGEDNPSEFTPEPVGYQRDYESYSSLTELINQPFDYVFDYLYNMKDEESGNLSQTEGNVAHFVISQMVEKSKNTKKEVDTKEFLAFCKDRTGLEKLVDQGIKDKGAVLLQPENAMECQIFKRIFIGKSLPNLVEIIEKNGLEVVDSEKDLTEDLNDSAGNPAFKFNARIDFILKKKNEETKEYEYYIFDFKWTRSANPREEEIKNHKELQLALYQTILETKGFVPVIMRGYYLLKQATLLTTYKFANADHTKIIPQKSTSDIFEQAVESYRERIANLQDGYIEEGEEMPGTKFEKTKFIDKYFNECKSKECVPDSYFLDNDVTMKFVKKSNTASMNTKGKKTTYGKNSVLKGKIK